MGRKEVDGMSNQSERIRAMLDERGVEHSDADHMTEWLDANGVRWNFFANDDGKTDLTMETPWEGLTPEQAIAATLGCGKLTAEQVREVIEQNFGKVAVIDDGGEKVEWREDWVCNVSFNFKAIADELNASIGGGR